MKKKGLDIEFDTAQILEGGMDNAEVSQNCLDY
jgi:hypothetical protein